MCLITKCIQLVLAYWLMVSILIAAMDGMRECVQAEMLAVILSGECVLLQHHVSIAQKVHNGQISLGYRWLNNTWSGDLQLTSAAAFKVVGPPIFPFPASGLCSPFHDFAQSLPCTGAIHVNVLLWKVLQ